MHMLQGLRRGLNVRHLSVYMKVSSLEFLRMRTSLTPPSACGGFAQVSNESLIIQASVP